MRMFAGLHVALVTPFHDDGSVDEAKLRELVRWHVAAGTDGLVPCGTTGESATLRSDERQRILRIVVAEARGALRVVAGAGTNSTAETVENLCALEGLGVDAALVITPYYNKPTQEGLFAHFRAAAQASPVPLVLYNVPGRTGVNLLPETLARLAEVEPRIVAIKESSGSLEQCSRILRLCGERLALLCGEDALTYPALCIGAVGVVSVVGNLVPRDIRAMIASHLRGDATEARHWHLRLLPLADALFLETNPTPVKAAMNLLGFGVGGPRLPLVSPRPETMEKLKRALAEYGLQAPVELGR
jgi:4-hydroxy-tetrahydrodipicolinate synthase